MATNTALIKQALKERPDIEAYQLATVQDGRVTFTLLDGRQTTWPPDMPPQPDPPAEPPKPRGRRK